MPCYLMIHALAFVDTISCHMFHNTGHSSVGLGTGGRESFEQEISSSLPAPDQLTSLRGSTDLTLQGPAPLQKPLALLHRTSCKLSTARQHSVPSSNLVPLPLPLPLPQGNAACGLTQLKTQSTLPPRALGWCSSSITTEAQNSSNSTEE